MAEHAGDALWTVAAYLTLAFAFPTRSPRVIALAAIGVSVAVECSQLIALDWLDSIRRTLPGRLLLGAGFLWADLIRYAAGAGLAWGAEEGWGRLHPNRTSETPDRARRI